MFGEDKLSTLFLALRSHLVRAVIRIVPPKEVEDIVQETYVRICQIDQSGRSSKESKALLFKTARNLALDYLKRSETKLTVSLDEVLSPAFLVQDEHVDQTFNQVASDQEFALFCEAVRGLPLQCRRVFVLKRVYGHSQREIARELNISESTVEKHVASGVKRCALFMRQHDRKKNVEKKPKRRNQTRNTHDDQSYQR